MGPYFRVKIWGALSEGFLGLCLGLTYTYLVQTIHIPCIQQSNSFFFISDLLPLLLHLGTKNTVMCEIRRAYRQVTFILFVYSNQVQVVCTLGSIVFVSILLIRGIWSGALYLQQSRNRRTNEFDDEHHAWTGAQPAS